MRLFVLLLCSLALAHPAAASDPFPSTLRLQRQSAYNRHHANQSGADGARMSSELTMQLVKGGKVNVRDKGRRSRYWMSRTDRVENAKTWTMHWGGTWQFANEVLRLKLTRKSMSCEANETRRGSKPQKKPCGAELASVVVECRTRMIAARSVWAAKPKKTAVWFCNGRKPLANGTSFPWVLGKQQCLRVAGDRGPRRYLHCKK